MLKHYKIAGLRIAMDTFARTAAQAAPYEIPIAGEPDIEISSALSAEERLLPMYLQSELEHTNSCRQFYTELLRFDGMMLHSSCVVVDGYAYLFTATSGTGKSTHTKLWLERFGDRAYILNDDKPALRFEDGVWYAYGTPWSGKHDISRNVRVPVAGIAVLERGTDNEIAPFSGQEAISFIMNQIVRPKQLHYRVYVLEIMDKLMRFVPLWKLKCNMDPEAADVSYNAMQGYRKELL